MISGIVVAGGEGRRFGSDLPKQFLQLCGKPVVAHAIDALTQVPGLDRIVLVLPGVWVQYATEAVLPSLGASVDVQVVSGGPRRRDSVAAGLGVLAESGTVVVHDGVRPLASPGLARRVTEAARQSGAAISAVRLTETLKHVRRGLVAETIAREGLWRVQTPQAFDVGSLREAHAAAPQDLDATDDAVLVERIGHKVAVVEGEATNIKITTQEDLRLAEALLHHGARRGIRVGIGFDAHAFSPERKLVLGGVTIPFDRGLAGHSDADVLAHAIADALLGAAGLGDIGVHFPPSEPSLKGISSMLILERVVTILSNAGYVPVAVDATVVAEKPLLASHFPLMRDTIARHLGLTRDAVSLKASTTEGLGFTGRQEGMAAMAVATVELS
jgi:2-C-methyl-D-erythritol 4-phosphate cytidylyltransferase/2-C-methyl-D-erythritol 2,4-cyclodiphosphate synthase